MSFSAVDRAMMGRALQLAEKAKYSVTPNPGVGAGKNEIRVGALRVHGTIMQRLVCNKREMLAAVPYM